MTNPRCNTIWLRNLKEGDEVVLDEFGTFSLRTVQSCTEEILVVSGRQYNRKDGVELGRGANATNPVVTEPTVALRNTIYRVQVVKKLKAVNWSKYPTARLEEVLEMLEAK